LQRTGGTRGLLHRQIRVPCMRHDDKAERVSPDIWETNGERTGLETPQIPMVRVPGGCARLRRCLD